jgi:hypothetical protein
MTISKTLSLDYKVRPWIKLVLSHERKRFDGFEAIQIDDGEVVPVEQGEAGGVAALGKAQGTRIEEDDAIAPLKFEEMRVPIHENVARLNVHERRVKVIPMDQNATMAANGLLAPFWKRDAKDGDVDVGIAVATHPTKMGNPLERLRDGHAIVIVWNPVAGPVVEKIAEDDHPARRKTPHRPFK